MGVHGLWRLIEPAGKPVPLETLENKVLAVDVSIWLHQAVKGFQDSRGAPIPNAHLLGIYHRVCKLLYFKVKPIFVFDGGIPALKKQTIAKRNQLKSKNLSEADRLQKQLLNTLLKHTAISKVLSEKTKASITAETKKTSQNENMYILPPSEFDTTTSSSEEESESMSSETIESSPTKNWDLHTIDMTSTNFKSLPVDVRHEILTELKETRKQSSWGRLHELPKQSDDFAVYQMKRLLKRQAVQSALDEAAQEMGGHSLSLAELELFLKDRGVATINDNVGKRIASNEDTRYLYIKDVKQAIEEAKKEQSIQKQKAVEETIEKQIGLQNVQERQVEDTIEKVKNKADTEFEDDIEKAIVLSLQDEPSTSKVTKEFNAKNEVDKTKVTSSFLENFNDADFQSDSSEVEEEEIAVKHPLLSNIQNYMTEYSGLTPNEIAKILGDKRGKTIKQHTKKNFVKKGIEEKASNVITINDEEFNDCEQIPKVCCNKNKKESVKIANVSESPSNGTDEEIANKINEAVAVMSDSEDSCSSKEFLEVPYDTDSKNSMEIIINPNETIEEDLFGDIFCNTKDIQTKTAMEVTIQPNSTSNNDFFENISNKKIEERKELENMEAEPEEQKDKKVIKEDEVLVLREVQQSVDVKKPRSSEEDSAPVEKEKDEVTDFMQNDTTTSKIESKDVVKLKLSVEQMREIETNLEKEKTDLLIEKSSKERMATNITDQMYQETQELLELFGVPYIVAPMEAEAQCAFLDEIALTDGTITDDSDIWLFGGKTVYKNFFDQTKYVMEFKAENIQHHFKLTRDQMILLALLVGSDYTIGIQGVGPVTALEVLAAFPPTRLEEFSLTHMQLISGLKEFRSWFTKGKTAGPGRSTLKSKLRNINFSDNFPSLQVVQAYLEPKVDEGREKFSWAKPDIMGLLDFARQKFGWSKKKSEEILNPVVKRLEENRIQKSIKDFYKTKYKIHSEEAEGKMSKRVKTAVNKIGKKPEDLVAEEMEALEKAKQKRTRKKKIEPDTDGKTEITVSSLSCDSSLAVIEKHKPKQKRMRKNKKNESISNSEEKNDKLNETQYQKDKSKNEKSEQNNMEQDLIKTTENISAAENAEDDFNELKQYENIALELKQRRQKKLAVSKDIQRPRRPHPIKKITPFENIPEELQGDEEIKFLEATTTRSLKRVKEIDQELKNELDLNMKKKKVQNLPKKEVIHQKLKDNSDILKNKMKAIEAFRKSKKGPGYVKKKS